MLILTVLLAVSSASPVSPRSLVPTSYAVDPSPGETRAGSVPGDGRARPGRADSQPPPPPPPPPPASPSASVPARSTPKPPPVELADRQPATRTTASHATRRTASEPAVPGLRVLPLGSGLVLIGLGVAFFAVRLRRG
ncbi:hypothetical protein ABZ837_18465 [Streptomyces sp. NPDC047197]|uniref:hypothetical protein n=1 Tax=Streptomyces sp. NPDC047197 TaxID=3155477 RepID=UPI0033FA2054